MDSSSDDWGQLSETCSPQGIFVSALTIGLLLSLLLWQCWKSRNLEVECEILEKKLKFLIQETGDVFGQDEAHFRKKLNEVLHQNKVSSYEVGYTWTYDRKANEIKRKNIHEADGPFVPVSPIRKRLSPSHLRGLMSSLAETPSPTPEPDNHRFRMTPPSSPAYILHRRFS